MILAGIFSIAIVLGIYLEHNSYNAFDSSPTPLVVLPEANPTPLPANVIYQGEMAWHGSIVFATTKSWTMLVQQNCADTTENDTTYININFDYYTLKGPSWSKTYRYGPGSYTIEVDNLCDFTYVIVRTI